MPIVWSPYGIGAMILFVVTAGLVARFVYVDYSDTENRFLTWGRTVLAFCAVMVAWNVASVICTGFAFGMTRALSVKEVAGAMGLQSDVAHPVEIGRSIDGTVGSGRFRLGYGSVTMTPGSSVSFQFAAADNTMCILEVPQRELDFKQVADASPKLEFSFLKEYAGRKYYESKAGGGLALDALHLTFHAEGTKSNAKFEGCKSLSDVIEGKIARATLTISPADYTKILKG